MIIRIRDEEGRKFTIPVPLWVVRFGMSNWIIKRASKHINEEKRKYLEQINFSGMSKCFGDLKKYRGLKMVDIKSKDGSTVEIIV